MLTLALDTATPWGRFALAEGGRLLAYRPYNVTGSYADSLLEQVDAVLAEGGRPRDAVAAVAVCRGPGSFTGVRMGVATAKALAHALEARLFAVTTLEAMAAAALRERNREPVVTVMDARRREVFWGVYRRKGGWVTPVTAPAVAAPDIAWRDLLAAVPDPDTAVLCGDGLPLLVGEGDALRPELAARGTPVLRQWNAVHPATAAALATAVSRGEAAIPAIHPFRLVPLYLRVSDAEQHRGLDLTPEAPSNGTEEAGGA